MRFTSWVKSLFSNCLNVYVGIILAFKTCNSLQLCKVTEAIIHVSLRMYPTSLATFTALHICTYLPDLLSHSRSGYQPGKYWETWVNFLFSSTIIKFYCFTFNICRLRMSYAWFTGLHGISDIKLEESQALPSCIFRDGIILITDLILCATIPPGQCSSLEYELLKEQDRTLLDTYLRHSLSHIMSSQQIWAVEGVTQATSVYQ